MDFRGADMQAAEAKDRLAAKDAEIARLREIISGVIVVANSGALKEFEGEPWLQRVLTTDI